MSISVICLCFFIIAVVYSSAGFGGGSSYIALLLVANLPMTDVRFIGLVCNIIVVSTSCYYFYKAGILKIRELLPLIILSIPFAFLGGLITPNYNLYKVIAGIALISASIIMLMVKDTKSKIRISDVTLSGVSGGIGFISGFIGIGGGIFLSPILYITNWNSAKKISAAASLFILVNSIAGLIGQSIYKSDVDWTMILLLVSVVFLGGQIGNRMNIHILAPNRIKLITAVLIAFVGCRILYIQYI